MADSERFRPPSEQPGRPTEPQDRPPVEAPPVILVPSVISSHPVAKPPASASPSSARAAEARPSHGQSASGTAARGVVGSVEAAAKIGVDDEASDRDAFDEVAEVIATKAPPWLVSAILHMVALIIMGLWISTLPQQEHLEINAVYAEQLGDQLEFDSPFAGDEKNKVEEPVITPQDLPQVENPFAAPQKIEMGLEGSVATSTIDAGQIGLALSGRQEGSRKLLLGRYGGTALTESAVDLGLEWLARKQKSDGSWSLLGPYPGGAVSENPSAATAMALIAFQGAGNTHRAGKFKTNVVKAWSWLLGQQDYDGCFFQQGTYNSRFYTHGLCTIALCELYGMTKDPKYLAPAERAVGYCVRSQGPQGGWRYAPVSAADTSVTGWIVMALQSARMAGIKVPADTLMQVSKFLDTVGDEYLSRYSYQRGGEFTPAMTAEALLCRQYLGWPRNDTRLVKGCEWIVDEDNLVNFERNRNVYFWYYATQVAHHMGGTYWRRWNEVMRQVVPERQVKRGKEAGSWDPYSPTADLWGAQGGRLYVTCLSIYMLEVYYRHLPIYQKVY